MKATTLILAIAAVAIFATTAQAGVLFTETFPYANGELTINDGTGDNVSGGLWTPKSGSTFNDNLQVLNGRLRVNNPGSEDAERQTGAVLGAGQKIFASFEFSVTGAPGSNINDDYFAHFSDAGFAFRSRVFTTDPLVGGDYTIGIAASGSGINAKWGSDLTFGTWYMLIHSYDFDTGDSELWINPISQASTSIFDNATVNEPTALNAAIEAYGIRQDFFFSGPDPTLIRVDNIIVGDTFADVVPEPATFALFALGGLALLRRRRR